MCWTIWVLPQIVYIPNEPDHKNKSGLTWRMAYLLTHQFPDTTTKKKVGDAMSCGQKCAGYYPKLPDKKNQDGINPKCTRVVAKNVLKLQYCINSLTNQ